jgi:hypothetical protein
LEQNLLSSYGECIAIYNGKGTLTLDDNQSLLCIFEVGQLRSGKVLLLCNFPTPPNFSPFVSPHKFEGTTTGDNFHISSIGSLTIADFQLDYNPGSQSDQFALYLVNGIIVQMAEGIQAESMRFGLTNFIFDEDITLCLQHESDVTMLTFRPINELNRVMQRVQILKGIEVTCEVIVNIAVDEDTARLEKVVNDLCYLLSVSQGTTIQWVYCDHYEKSGKCLSRKHAARIVKAYSPLSIINIAREVMIFLEKTYDAFVTNRELYQLDMLIEAYLAAKDENDPLQLRGVKLAVAIEALKAVLLKVPELNTTEYILEYDFFKSLRGKIQKFMSQELKKEKNIDKTERDAMYKKLPELNRRAFEDVLTAFFNHIGLRVEAQDLDHFISSRNSLVHQVRFYSETATEDERKKVEPFHSLEEEYFFLVSFLDKVILKLLGYSGPYSDWSSLPNPTRRESI